MISNINSINTNNFRFDLQRVPNLSYFVQNVNLPGITAAEVDFENPFSNQWQTGDKLVFETLEVSFLVDEEMKNWLEIHNWMRSYGFDKNFSQYKEPTKSDATLTITTNKKNPLYQVTFENVWPIALSELSFATNITDEDELISSASFRYQSYNIEKVI